MKARVHIIMISLMLIFGKSYGYRSEMILTNLDGAPFYVIFDGEVIDPNSSILSLSDILPGTHTVDVYRYIRDSRGFFTKYVEMVHRGSIFIEANTRVVVHLTRGGRLTIVSRLPLSPPSGGGHGMGSGKNSHGGGSGYNGSHGSHMPPVMTMPEFNRLKISVREASFESTKLAIAREGMSHFGITSDMVFEIMRLFSFEATKLEFAKWAYLRTTDRHNYHLVNRAFSFEATKRELLTYISMQG